MVVDSNQLKVVTIGMGKITAIEGNIHIVKRFIMMNRTSKAVFAELHKAEAAFDKQDCTLEVIIDKEIASQDCGIALGSITTTWAAIK